MTPKNTQESPILLKHWMMWAIAALFYAYQYIPRILPSIIKDELTLKFNIDANDFGNFNGLYYGGYILVHMPIAILLERYGPKYVLSICALLCGIGVLPPILSDQWVWSVLGRFILGIGSSSSILGIFYVLRRYFPTEKFSSILGLAVTIGLSGGVFGSRPVGYLKDLLGWESLVYTVVSGSVVIAALFYFLMPGGGQDYKTRPHLSLKEDLQRVWEHFKYILHNRHVWYVALLSGLMIGTLEGFADGWGVSYFIASNISPIKAQYLVLLMYVGMAFGGPILGFLGEKVQRFYSLLVGCGVIMLACYLMLFLSTDNSIPQLSLIMVTLGMLSAYQIYPVFINSQVVPKQAASLASSFTNMVMMGFGIFFHKIIGIIITQIETPTLMGSALVYSEQAYIWGLSIIPISVMMAIIGLWIIKPKDERKILENTVNS